MAPKAKKSAAKKAVKKSAPAKTAPAKKAPVKKAVVKKVAAKKAVSKKVAVKKAPAKKAVVKKAPAKKAVVKKTAPKKAPTKKATPSKLTTIGAKIDVGFGNMLYLRGSGGGLSWDKGVVMGNAASNEWVWSSDKAAGSIEFKILINDEYWSAGENNVVEAGHRVDIDPSF